MDGNHMNFLDYWMVKENLHVKSICKDLYWKYVLDYPHPEIHHPSIIVFLSLAASILSTDGGVRTAIGNLTAPYSRSIWAPHLSCTILCFLKLLMTPTE